MEEQSISDIVRKFLPLLMKKEKDENLKIVYASEVPGSNPGDNYMSTIIRTEIRGILGDGKPYEKSFITKRFPYNRQLVVFARTEELFRNEAYVYRKFLPLIGSETFAPECIYADSEKIVMEDLSRENFSICDRRSLLDLEHCLLVIQTLASFHAKSLSIKLKNPAYFQSLMEPMTESVFPPDSKPSLGQTIVNGLNSAILSLESIHPSTEKLEEAIEFLKKYESNAYNIIRKLITTREKYHVLTHGDVWINNILFARTSESNENLRVKFVDFQAARHSSPATDFHYFVYSSSRSTVIEQNYEDLVKLYHSSFLHDLRQLKVPEEDCQSLNIEWFEKELRKYAIYGLFSALNLVHAILASDNSVTINTSENDQELCSNVPITPEKTERIQYILSHYIRTYK